jgi:PAS domain S-box-containing protein
MSFQDGTDQSQDWLAYLPPTARQTRSALAVVAALLLGLAVLGPMSGKPMPHVNGFIPAIDATIFVTDFITAILLLVHFSIVRSRALLALACGYIFSALIVLAHGLGFPGAFSPTGNFGGSSQSTIRLYLSWHLGIPTALFVYISLKQIDGPNAGLRMPATAAAIFSVAGVLALAGCTVWLAAAGDVFLPSILIVPDGPVALWLIVLTLSMNAAALAVLGVFQRSALDQWLMVVVLASMVELAITLGFGGVRFTLGFYTGRIFSIITSTVVLTVLLAETTRLYARLARANRLAGVVEASRTLSGEIELVNLIKRLMTVAIENAGAERGLLILPSGNQFLINAEARAIAGRVEVFMYKEPITRLTCPESLIRHVIRTKESVLIDDASKLNPFSADDYLRDRKSKSVLCLPLVRQRELAGFILLENASTSYAFTPIRIAVLKLLAAQAAISLENTRLYNELQEREMKVRRLIDSNIIGIVIGNPDGHIQEANQAFLRIVGYDQADVVASRLRRTELTPPEWHDRDARALAEMRKTGTVQPFEKEYFRKDGSRVPVLIGGATLDKRGDTVVIFVLDLTERKHAEAELAHANRVATMGQLSASIAHEINQPIGATLMNSKTAARWLSREPPNLEEAKQAIDLIISDSKRAASILSRIRNFSKTAPVRKEYLNINETILDIVGLARVPMSNSGIVAKMQLSEGLPQVLGDKVQLQQVILNLVMNAVEAMSDIAEETRYLSISTNAAEPDGVLVKVSDSGPGLSPADIARIFEPFYTTKANGLGMGLSVCRSIIDAHGGELRGDNESTLGGACFRFNLPGNDVPFDVA